MCDGESNANVDVEPLDRLVHAIEGFVWRPEELTEFAIGERLIRLRHAIDLLELHFAREAAAFAATSEFEIEGSASPIDWVRHNCAMSGNAAARSMATGEEADQLPESVAALDEGRIGFAHLTMLAGNARAVQGATGAGGFDERPLLELALEHSVSRFAFDCTHARHQADAAAVLAEQVKAVDSRWLELRRYEDGRVGIRGVLDPVGGATLRVALAPLCAPSGADDDRPRQRRFADGLVELAVHTLDHGFATERGGTRPHLQLTASVETVMGVAGAPGGDLEFAGVVPAATVQRLG